MTEKEIADFKLACMQIAFGNGRGGYTESANMRLYRDLLAELNLPKHATTVK